MIDFQQCSVAQFGRARTRMKDMGGHDSGFVEEKFNEFQSYIAG